MSDRPCITALSPTKRDPSRVSIKVGRKHIATLSQKLVGELGLAVGQSWDDALADRVEAATVYDQAMRKALNRLNHRAMSRGQLDRKLRELEFDEPTRTAVLDRLAELRLLDDEAFGRALIRETLARKPAGPRLLQQKLYQKGLPRELIDRLVAEATADSDDQREQATRFAETKLRSMQRLDLATRKRRLYGQLARRGFSPDVIRDVMEKVTPNPSEY